MVFICYNKCSTCKKAQAFLDSHGLSYESRPIKEQNPTPRSWSNGTSKAVCL